MSVLNLSWGLPIMDRRSKVHVSSRVQLPQSVVGFDSPAVSAVSTARNTPIVPRYLGIAGFVTCGAIVIVTATFLALSI